MSWIKRARDLGGIACISMALILLIDGLFGSSILSFTSGSSEKYYRVRHPVYHHTLRANVDSDMALWGSTFYRICTNEFGFKSRCDSAVRDSAQYDLAFIGDSFTEAIGLRYSDSFVGIIDADHPELSIANLAVASYSPKIYLSKIRFLLDRGLRFDHLLVFVDISDVVDDETRYIYKDGTVYDAIGGLTGSDNTIDRAGIFFYELRGFVVDHFPIAYELQRGVKRLVLGTGTSNFLSSEGLGEGFRGEAVFDLDKSAWTYDPDRQSYGPAGVEGAVRRSVEYMIELHELLRSQGIELSVGVYPWPGQLAHDTAQSRQVRIWSNFCRTRCSHFVDLFPLFFDHLAKHGLADTYEKHYIPGDLHFNKVGNAVIAHAIADQLRMPVD